MVSKEPLSIQVPSSTDPVPASSQYMASRKPKPKLPSTKDIPIAIIKNPESTLASLDTDMCRRRVNHPTLVHLMEVFMPPIRESAKREYASFYNINEWFLGANIESLPYYAVYRPVFRTLQFSYYCAIVAASMGDIARGSWRAQIADLKKSVHVPLPSPPQSFLEALAGGGGEGGDRGDVGTENNEEKDMTMFSSPPTSPLDDGGQDLKFVETSTVKPRTSMPSMLSLSNPSSSSFSTSIFSPSSSFPPPSRPVSLYSDAFNPDVPSMSERNAKRDRDVLLLVTAASRIPSRVNCSLKKKVLAGLGVDGMQTIGCCIGLMAFTNVITDFLGVQLTFGDVAFAQEFLATGSDWNLLQHAPTGIYKHDMGSDSDLSTKTSKSILNRLGDYKTLLKDLGACDKQSAHWALTIPTAVEPLHGFLRDRMGFLPNYIMVLKDPEAKRAVAFFTWCFLLRPDVVVKRTEEDVGSEEMTGAFGVDPCVEDDPVVFSREERCLMMFVFATVAGNQLLRGHAGFVGVRFGLRAERFREVGDWAEEVSKMLMEDVGDGGVGEMELDEVTDCGWYGTKFPPPPAFLERDPVLHASLLVVIHAAQPPSRREYPSSLTSWLFGSFEGLGTGKPHVHVVELAATVGYFNLVHRVAGIVAPEPVCFEEEVVEFLRGVGMGLGVDPGDAGFQRKEERDGNGISGDATLLSTPASKTQRRIPALGLYEFTGIRVGDAVVPANGFGSAEPEIEVGQVGAFDGVAAGALEADGEGGGVAGFEEQVAEVRVGLTVGTADRVVVLGAEEGGT
ncbi:hypothetical protein HDU97_009918 [Phlyctochytrium planicorne]|nr:hypothetical protein HDU97_009918 [Phlyctochytrium planicorne]